ncbi:alpha/beta fold hydrolase [Dactylosporangium cerinum]
MEFLDQFLDRGTDRLALHTYPVDDAATLAVLWPAMGVPARYYRHFAAALNATGIEVVVADLRGTGSSTPRPSRASRYGLADLTADVEAVLDILKPRRAGRRTLLVGHSSAARRAPCTSPPGTPPAWTRASTVSRCSRSACRTGAATRAFAPPPRSRSRPPWPPRPRSSASGPGGASAAASPAA